MKQRNEQILSGNIKRTLIKITIPSIFGMFGMMVFNIVDTYFVGRLGSTELAAISFTFPVVLVLNSLVFGVGTAAMTLFSKASGEQNSQEKQLLATLTLILGIMMSIIIGVIGRFTIEPLFRFLGADDQLLPFILDFMKIWYMGAGFIVIPMLGDSILRGLGDTVTPAIVMIIVAVLNLILDPLLIFGIGPFAMMGIRGAALATVISRGIAALVSILIQIFREHLIIIKGLKLKYFKKYWKELLHIGIPNSAIRAITPLGTAIFTSILAKFGHEAVAGYGVATKVESIFIAIINASTITTTVFVGQNMGAKNNERTKSGIKILGTSLFFIGILLAIVFFFSGKYIGKIFNDNPLVYNMTALYLSIVPFGYGFFAMTQMSAAIMNVFHKPYVAAGLSFFQIGVIAVPFSYLLSSILGAGGVFYAVLLSFIFTGIVSLFILRKYSKKYLN